MTATILVVDDDHSMCELLATQIEDAGWKAVTAAKASAALRMLSQHPVDLVLTDLRMPGTSGTELCREIVSTRPDVPVIVMTGFGSIDNAIGAIRAGAYDFVTKPFEYDALRVIVQRALNHRRLQDEVRKLRRSSTGAPGFEGLVGTSPAMQRVYDLVDRVAGADASVLLIGESGTGKELLARALHARSARAGGPFVGVNCAAVPEQLLESELFGHEKGAFTDAHSNRHGLLRQAHGGTLFLDEIGDMSQALQPKLLRCLQERVVRPVGSDAEIGIDVRIIAATNHDLHAALEAGRFRVDLYYRLAVVTIEVPPLREREDDVLLLAEHFVDQLAVTREMELNPRTQRMLEAHTWPGNVRELRNAIEHAIAVAPGKEILPEHLPASVVEATDNANGRSSDTPAEPDFLPLDEVERRHILRVLDAVHGNKSKAARILGIDRKTLHSRLLRYGR